MATSSKSSGLTTYTDEDIVSKLQALTGLVGGGATEPSQPGQAPATPGLSLEAERDLMDVQYGNVTSAITASIGPLRKIWAGFKAGLYSEFDTLDKVADVISNVTGWEKGGAFERLKEYVAPAEAEMPTPGEGLGSKVLRGIGAAIPIIAEFVAGTKGTGYVMGKVGAPTAVKLGARIGAGEPLKVAPTLLGRTMSLYGQPVETGVSAGLSRLIGAGQAIPKGTRGVVGLAAPTYFGGREALTGALEAPEGEKTMGAVTGLGKGLAMGLGLEAAGMIPSVGKIPGAALRVPAVSTLFGAQAAAAGEEVIPSAIVGAVLAAVPELTRVNAEIKGIRQPKATGVTAPPKPGTPEAQAQQMASTAGGTTSTKDLAATFMRQNLINKGLPKEVADQLPYDVLKDLIDRPLSSYSGATLNPKTGELTIPGRKTTETDITQLPTGLLDKIAYKINPAWHQAENPTAARDKALQDYSNLSPTTKQKLIKTLEGQDLEFENGIPKFVPKKVTPRKKALEKASDEVLNKIVTDSNIADEALKQDASAEIKSRVQKRQKKAAKIEETLPKTEENAAPAGTNQPTQNRVKFQTIAQELIDAYRTVKDKKTGKSVRKISPEAIISRANDYNISQEDLPELLAFLKANDIWVVDTKALGISDASIEEAVRKLMLLTPEGKERTVSEGAPQAPTETAVKIGEKLTPETAEAAWNQASELAKSTNMADVLKAQSLHEQVYAYLGFTGTTLPEGLTSAKVIEMIRNKAKLGAKVGKTKKGGKVVKEGELNKPEVLEETEKIIEENKAKMKKEGKKTAKEKLTEAAKEPDVLMLAMKDGKISFEEWSALTPQEKEIATRQLEDLYEIEGAMKQAKARNDTSLKETIDTLQEEYDITLEDFEYVVRWKPGDKSSAKVRAKTLKDYEEIYLQREGEGLGEVEEPTGPTKMERMQKYAQENLGWTAKSLKSVTDEAVLLEAIKERKLPDDYDIINGQFVKKSTEALLTQEQERMKEIARKQGIKEGSDAWNAMFPEIKEEIKEPAKPKEAPTPVTTKGGVKVGDIVTQTIAGKPVQMRVKSVEPNIEYEPVTNITQPVDMAAYEKGKKSRTRPAKKGEAGEKVGEAETPEGEALAAEDFQKALKKSRPEKTLEDAEEATPEDIMDRFVKLGGKSDEKAQFRDQVDPDELVSKAINGALTEAKALQELYARQQSLIDAFDRKLADLTSLSQQIRKAKKESVREALLTQRANLETQVRDIVSDMDAIMTATRPSKRTGILNPGQIELETNIINPDGVPVATIISQGVPKGGKFYVMKSAMGGEVGKTAGNIITGVAELRERSGKGGRRLELKVFDVQDKDPMVEDALLSSIINKAALGENPKRIEHIAGIADEAWNRRKDVSFESLTNKDAADFKSFSRQQAERIAAARRLEYDPEKQKALELSPTERKEALINASKIGADVEKVSKYYNEPTSLQPQRQDMVPWLERYGDLSQSTNPMIRAIGNIGVQFELQSKQLVSKFLKYRNEALGWMKGDPEMQQKFFKHLYDIERSHDTRILEAEQAWRFIHDSIARMFKLEERGLYLKKYATYIYDMNKIWDFFGRPLDSAKSYIELPDTVLSKLEPEWFNQIKEIRQRYPEWDKMPPALQQFVQLKYLNWGGGYADWTYLPEEMKAVLPEHKFNAYFKQRTAGDRLKFALNEDVFDTSTMYIVSAIRNGLLNDYFLPHSNSIARQMPFSGVKGTYRKLADDYIRMMSGFGAKSSLDNSWNAFANFVNTRLFHADAIPLYIPREAASLYQEALYRGAIGPDTAIRNLTQFIYTFADVGGKNFFKGFLKYLEGAWTKNAEYKKFKEHLSIGDEFFAERLQALKKSNPTAYEKFKYYNQRLTNLVLHPMQISEHINKGIAYFAGLEEAAAKGYDFNTAHIIGMKKAGEVMPSLEYSEAQWYALNKMYSGQFGYSTAHKSPYLQGTGMRFLTPFWSFPIKTAQFLQKGFKEGWWEHLSGDNAKLVRFMALTGFLATAPQLLAETVGLDAYSLWGKGMLPAVALPAFVNGMKDAWTALGLNDSAGIFDKETSKNNLQNLFLLFALPQWRWLKKGALSLENLDKAHTTWGRADSPLTETNFFNEFLTMFGWPPSNRREAREFLKDYKDMASERIIKKHEAIMDIIEYQEKGDYRKAVDVLNDMRKEGINISASDVNHTRARRETDAFELQYKMLPKEMKTPELQRKFREAQQQFLGGRYKYRGSKPMWSAKPTPATLSEEIE